MNSSTGTISGVTNPQWTTIPYNPSTTGTGYVSIPWSQPVEISPVYCAICGDKVEKPDKAFRLELRQEVGLVIISLTLCEECFERIRGKLIPILAVKDL